MSTGTWTSLSEAQKLTEDMKIAGVIEEIIKEGGILPRLPGLTVRGKSVVYNRERSIPTASFYAADADISAIAQNVVNYDEITVALKILIGEVLLDRFVIDTYPTINDMRAAALSAARKGFAFKLEDTIIYGDSSGNLGGDPAAGREFDGLHSLLVTNGYRQWEASTSAAVGDVVVPRDTPTGFAYRCLTSGTTHTSEPTWSTTFGGVTTEGGGSTVTWQTILLQVMHNGSRGTGGANGTPNALSLIKLDELIDIVKPKPDVLLTNRNIRRRLSAAMRDTSKSGYMPWTKDEFGHQILVYNDIPVLASDYLTQTELLSVDGNEYSAKTGGTSSTIFAIHFGLPDDGGVSLLTGGGEVIQSESFEKLEGRLAGKERLFSFVAMALGATNAAAAMTGVKDDVVGV